MRISVTAWPSIGASAAQVPYFVRVINNSGGVLQGQEFTADFRLTSANPRGTSQEELTLRLPYNEISDLAGYRIAVGLKPTQEELNYNRQATNGRERSAARVAVTGRASPGATRYALHSG